MKSKRQSDGPWRAEVIDRYGLRCVVPGCTNRWIQADHVWPKAQGRKDPRVRDPRNGVPLCRDHHEDKTHGRLRYRHEWLLPDTVEFLAEVGWVAWDNNGEPYGRGWRHFAPLDRCPPGTHPGHCTTISGVCLQPPSPGKDPA